MWNGHATGELIAGPLCSNVLTGPRWVQVFVQEHRAFVKAHKAPQVYKTIFTRLTAYRGLDR